ncbi:MAG: UvrD-helicase domain-containing protein, partial [SAR202 cluster bacterium]|nr:UvrD-helicase domain-containing protein [SAR202 cluster bacterium]
MNAPFVPADQDQRDRIRESLDETLFVEAGAGTGKTTSLVERVVGLVSKGVTTLDRIAAITFTEAAAAELSDKVREALEKA